MSKLDSYSCRSHLFWNCPYVKEVWETTARQLATGEWKFRVASKIHFILAGLASNSMLAGLASNSCYFVITIIYWKASRNLKTLATVTGLQL